MAHVADPPVTRQTQRFHRTEVRPLERSDARVLASLWEIEKRLDAISLELLEISASESRHHEVGHHHRAL